jgi:RHS repeat-associated protein
MTLLPQPKSPGKLWAATYDAWNRLVKVVNDDNDRDVQQIEYDPLNRRIVKQADFDGDGSFNEVRHYYYSDQWQVVEERVGSDPLTARVDVQYVWNPEYVDSLALRYWDSNSSGGPDKFQYYLQDANYNVTAVTDDAGAVVERYAYTPYGEVTVLNGASDYNSEGIDWSVDTAGTDIKNVYLYTGRERDAETGIQINRWRYYAAHLGRWLTRDPLGYLGSWLNLYQYVDSGPTNKTDPIGESPIPGIWPPPFRPKTPPGLGNMLFPTKMGDAQFRPPCTAPCCYNWECKAEIFVTLGDYRFRRSIDPQSYGWSDSLTIKGPCMDVPFGVGCPPSPPWHSNFEFDLPIELGDHSGSPFRRSDCKEVLHFKCKATNF